MLADELAKAQQREQIAAWDRGEAAIRSQLAVNVPARSLSADVRDRFGLFEKWCSDKSVRRLPAKPWVVAAFILDQTANGRDAQGCLALLAAIDDLHQHHGLASPVHTQVVRAALETFLKTAPPRSWNNEERAEFALLPPDIRHAIARREAERDKALRLAQNRLAEERKRLSSGADTKPAQTNKDYEYVTTSQV